MTNLRVIAVDGNVNAGKTTLLKQLCSVAAAAQPQYLPEHSNLLCQVTQIPEESDVRGQGRYLQTERIRLSLLRDSPAGLFLLDRSFVSILAHTLATTPGHSDSRSWLVSRLSSLVGRAQVCIPHCFVFIDVPYSISRARYLANTAEKGTPAELIDPGYFECLRRIYLRWATLVGGHALSSPEEFDLSSLRLQSYNPVFLARTLQEISRDEI